MDSFIYGFVRLEVFSFVVRLGFLELSFGIFFFFVIKVFFRYFFGLVYLVCLIRRDLRLFVIVVIKNEYSIFFKKGYLCNYGMGEVVRVKRNLKVRKEKIDIFN